MSAAPPSARLLLFGALAALSACEPMETSGDPLQPVPVAAAAVAADAGDDGAADDLGDPRFDDVEDEPFTLSSEDLRGEGSPTPPAPDGPPAVEPPAAEDGLATLDLPEEPLPPAPVVQAPPPAPAPAPAAQGFAAPSAWPVRLVRTLPETQPPRAILGLADGREIVVTPGSMVPDEQLVVMAIGRSTLQVARLTPNGDHAVVTQTTLTAQY